MSTINGCNNKSLSVDNLKYVMNSNDIFMKKINSILNETILKKDKEYKCNFDNYFFCKFHKQYEIDRLEGEKMYYKEKFGIDGNEKKFEEERKEIIKCYLAGLQWNLYYYKGFINWNWNYKYNYAPLLLSLSKYPSKKEDFKDLNKEINDIIYENNEEGDKVGSPLHPIVLQCLSYPPNINSCNFIPSNYKDNIYNMIPEYFKFTITIDNNGFAYYSKTTVVCPKLKGKEIIKKLIEFKVQDDNNINDNKDIEYLYDKSSKKREYKRKRKNKIFNELYDGENQNKINDIESNKKDDNKKGDKKCCQLSTKKLNDKCNYNNNCQSKKIDINFPSIYIKNAGHGYGEISLDVDKKDKKGRLTIKIFYIDLTLEESESKKMKNQLKNEDMLLRLLEEKIISYGYPQLKIGLLKSIYYDNKFYKNKGGKLVKNNYNCNYFELIEKDYRFRGIKISEPFCLIEVIPIIYIDHGCCVYDEDYKYLIPLEITSLLYVIEKKEVKKCIKDKDSIKYNKDNNNKYIEFLEEKKLLIKSAKLNEDEKYENDKKIFLFDETLRNGKVKDKKNNTPVKQSNKNLRSKKNAKKYYENYDNDDICELYFNNKYFEEHI